MFETLLTESRIALAAGRRDSRIDSSIIDEHTALLDALRAGDRRRALALVEKHMESGVRRCLSEGGHVLA
jgi:DNA-binding GntR family transcriptional regulator